MRMRRIALAAALLALGFTPIACNVASEPPTVFDPAQEIPLGELSLSVTGWETVPEKHAPISVLRAAPGEKVIAVFVRWSGLATSSDLDRRLFLERYFESHAKVVDDAGFVCRAFDSMPRELYRFQPFSRHAPPDWVIVFHVWIDSQNHTLLLEHPDPAASGVRRAAVQLL